MDIRILPTGELAVIDVKWANTLAGRGSFALAAKAAGYDHARLIARILEVAAARYEVATSGVAGSEAKNSVVVLPEHTAAAK